jgi:glutathione reductase (NADPH)
MDGRTAARNMISGNTLTTDYQTVPSVVFTSPLLASVGHGEDEAEKYGIKVACINERLPIGIRAAESALPIQGTRFSQKINQAGSLASIFWGTTLMKTINLFALAIKAGMRLADLQEAAWAYPTADYDINRIR